MLDSPEPGVGSSAPAPEQHRSRAARLRRSVLPCLRTSLLWGAVVLTAVATALALVVAGGLAVLREVNPPGSALMWGQSLAGTRIDQRWVPLRQISPNLLKAVIIAEDNQFCQHRGIDWTALEELYQEWGRQEQGEAGAEMPSRGGSTISMQVAKNLFLWSSRSVLRKAIEIPLAGAIELMWSKERVLEVYLNIAEWGPGIFGAEAAAQHHFRKPASRLTEREAARLAAALPNPHLRVASRPGPIMLKVAEHYERRMRDFGTRRAACVLGR